MSGNNEAGREWWCDNCQTFCPATEVMGDLLCGCRHIIASFRDRAGSAAAPPTAAPSERWDGNGAARFIRWAKEWGLSAREKQVAWNAWCAALDEAPAESVRGDSPEPSNPTPTPEPPKGTP